jgi:hypothetical protein
MATHQNPYNRGNYFNIMAFILEFAGKAFTKAQVMEHSMTELEMGEKAALASVGVVMSPRSIPDGKEWPVGAGNFSAQGHLYFLHKLNRKKVEDEEGNEVLEEQRYQLRWRKESYHPFTRETQYMTQDEITEYNRRKEDARSARKQAAEGRKAEAAERKATRLAKKAEKEAEVAERKAAREAKKAEKEAAAIAHAEGVAHRKELRETANKAKADAAIVAETNRNVNREAKRLRSIANAKENLVTTATNKLAEKQALLETAQAEFDEDSEDTKVANALETAQVAVDHWQEKLDERTPVATEAVAAAEAQEAIAAEALTVRETAEATYKDAYQAYKDAKEVAKATQESNEGEETPNANEGEETPNVEVIVANETSEGEGERLTEAEASDAETNEDSEVETA